MTSKRYIAYYRVSTARQGQSGLGLEAQQTAVRSFVAADAGIIEEYVEVESGRRNDRPRLLEALAACRRHKAVLIIAKLDRLARNVAFVSNLMEAGVDFVAVDMPHASRLTVHILAAVAEHEREMISQRTKAALAAAKARGTRLGNQVGNPAGLSKARQRASEIAGDRAENVRGIIDEIRVAGLTSFRQIAAAMNARGIESPRGARWYAGSVRRLLVSQGAIKEKVRARREA
ncbi:MAG: recombinase family protein [Gammaproteobacteria bacterium]|uniref:recombinase family protein n=1 Tax=Thalassobaculum sp. TaxID=2022740 RepID=UPI0032EDA409